MRSPSPDHWRRIEPILEAALDLDENERADYLGRACDGDEELRAEVEALLESDVEAEHFLSGAVGEYAPTLLEAARAAFDGATGRAPAPSNPIELPGTSERHYLPGTVLAGRYRIFGLIGEGGMGEVYRADDLKLGQVVALKFLPESVERQGGLTRFLSEVRLARQIAHPNVCRVYDVGEVDGRHYLSMEFVDGEDLASLLRRIGRVPEEKAIVIGRELALGLAAAHEQGILHRDLKPANVMIDGRGRARITDFGLAALTGDVRGGEVRSGTPTYMAPEQLRGEEVGEKSDIYSLGLVLFELVTGRRPHRVDTRENLSRPDASAVTDRPSSHVDGLDPAVESIILRCLEPEPDARPPSAWAVAAALPGGDALAAARAAGETPSPEMVAEAAGSEGLKPRLAVLCLVSLLAGLLWLALSAPDAAFNSRAPWEKTPTELALAAREIVRQSGWDPPLADSGYGFKRDRRFLEREWTAEERTLPWADPATARPAPVLFWYRQASVPLVPYGVRTRLSQNDPPASSPGGVNVELDPRGELVRFRAMPTRNRQVDSEAALEAKWQRFLESAGIALESLQPIEPQLEPSFRADSEVAWRGWFRDQPGTGVRVEAASFRGRPVYFEVVPIWSEGVKLERLGVGDTPPVVGGMMLAALLGSVLLARRNLRLGRADRRGAFRLAMFGILTRAASWLLTTHHVASGLEVQQVFKGLLQITFVGGVIPWLSYLALEPFVRRLWPESLTSWNRLVDGRLRDPVVGRHVLQGALAGTLVACSSIPLSALMRSLGRTDWVVQTPQIAIGVASVASQFLSLLQYSVRMVLMGTVLFLLVRLLLRRRWVVQAGLGLLVLVLIMANPGQTILRFTAMTGILLVLTIGQLLVRLGLVSAIACMFFAQLPRLPLTLDPGSWLIGQTVFTLALFAAVAGYGFYTSLGGRSLISWQALEGES